MRISGLRAIERDRGTAIIEAAFAVPLTIAVIINLFGFGLVTRISIVTNRVVAGGARYAAVVATDPDGDRRVLVEIFNRASGIPSSSIERIVIFHANHDGLSRTDAPAGASSDRQDNRVNPECLTPGSLGSNLAGRECNVYYPTDINNAVKNTGFTPKPSWTAVKRQADFVCHTTTPLLCPNAPEAHIGVYVRIIYKGPSFDVLLPEYIERQTYYSFTGS